MSLGITVGAKASERGAKGALLSAAKKIGWTSGNASAGGGIYSRSLHSHRLSGHSMANGFAGRENVANYDPKDSYKARMNSDYDRGRMSGSGAISGSMKRFREQESMTTPLSRNGAAPISRELSRFQTTEKLKQASKQDAAAPQFASFSPYGVGNKTTQGSSLKTKIKF